MGRIRLSIDNREVQVEEGTTILQAAVKAGIEIPSLCHEEELSHAAGAAFASSRWKGHAIWLPRAPVLLPRTWWYGPARTGSGRREDSSWSFCFPITPATA